MEATIKGNNIRISLTESENNIVYTMPDGYSYEAFLLTGFANINYINPLCKAVAGTIYNFPPVKSKSPSTITLLKNDSATSASALITIIKFGQIPDTKYFEKVFEPILVSGDDGKEYNVIPSDQFK